MADPKGLSVAEKRKRWNCYDETDRQERPANCQNCRKEAKLDGHHISYDMPHLVVWLCRSCHLKLDQRSAGRNWERDTRGRFVRIRRGVK